MITYEQVASTLDPALVCEIAGTHKWDIDNAKLLEPAWFWPKKECLKCGMMKDNDLFDPEKRKTHGRRGFWGGTFLGG